MLEELTAEELELEGGSGPVAVGSAVLGGIAGVGFGIGLGVAFPPIGVAEVVGWGVMGVMGGFMAAAVYNR